MFKSSGNGTGRTGISGIWKKALFGALASAVLTLILVFITALLFGGGLQVSAISAAGWIITGVAGFLCGIFSSAGEKEDALLKSLASAAILFLVSITAGLFFKGGPSFLTLALRAVECLVLSCVGGFLISQKKKKYKSRYRA